MAGPPVAPTPIGPMTSVSVPETPHRARVASAMGPLGALAGGVIVYVAPAWLVDDRWVLVGCCGLLALAGFASIVGGVRVVRWIGAVTAVLRLSTVMLAMALWRGEARDFWGALSVWVAWRDADEGLCATRPLVPLAVALVAVFAWAGVRGSPAGPRALLVACVAALAVGRVTPRA